MNKELNPILLNIVEQRGISRDELDEFFSPKPQLTFDPFLLADMRAGVDLLLSEIDKESNIVVYGDYDVDGVTATSIMVKALRCLTDNVSYYIPSRIEEGYGLNKEAIDKIHEDGGDLIITVDCGAVSCEEAEYAHSLGIKTIVTDHHNVEQACASGIVIDPQRPDDEYPFKGLAGVGVAYKFIQAVSRERELPRDLITEMLELVAVGTIADIMPLVSENRTIVKYGLRLMHIGCRNKGLKRLIELAGLDAKTIKASNISFGIAPRINAAGRIGDATTGVRLFLSEDDGEIEECCTALIQANSRRKELQDEAYKQCVAKAAKELDNGDFILVEAEDVHEGVLGIVAGKIKEEFYRPVVIVAENGIGYKGTGRSIPQVDLFEMLSKYSDRFIKFGGHRAACGFSIDKAKLDELRVDLNRDLSEKSASCDDFFAEEVRKDAIISPDDITVELVEALSLLEPCGQGNEAPILELCGVTIDEWRYLKNDTKYAKLIIGGVECMLFRDAYKYFDLYEGGVHVNVTGSLELNAWNGSVKPQLILERIVCGEY